jgi:hypothetical protein
MTINHIRNTKDPEFRFPLKLLQQHIPYAFYQEGMTPPNLRIFNPIYACVGLFTVNGVLTMTGGNNNKQIAQCLFEYLNSILEVVVKLFPTVKREDFVMGELQPKTRTCTNKLTFHSINVHNFSAYCNKLRPCIFQSERSRACTLIPLPEYSHSLKVNLFPKGGINILGSKMSLEVEYISFLVIALIKPFLIIDPAKELIWEKGVDEKKEELKILAAALTRKHKRIKRKIHEQAEFDENTQT